MAVDNRSIVITIKLDSGNDTNASEISSAVNTKMAASKSNNNSGATALAVFAVAQLVETTVSEVTSWCNYYAERELILNDDYVTQRKKSIAATQIGRFVNAGGTILSTTVGGALSGGVVGAIIGAVIGTTKVVSSTIRGNVQAQEQQSIQIKQMDNQLNFTRSRAGWSLKAASIGEDL